MLTSCGRANKLGSCFELEILFRRSSDERTSDQICDAMNIEEPQKRKGKKGRNPIPRFIEGNIAVTWINQKMQNMGELLGTSNDFLVLSNRLRNVMKNNEKVSLACFVPWFWRFHLRSIEIDAFSVCIAISSGLSHFLHAQMHKEELQSINRFNFSGLGKYN